MADTRDSSLSPMSRSPRSNSPKPDSEEHNRALSPLRFEQRLSASGASNNQVPDILRPGAGNSPTAAGFPFLAPNGTSGDVTAQQVKPPNLEPSPSFNQVADPSDFNSHGHLSTNSAGDAGSFTPVGRRSVQFVRNSTQDPAPTSNPHSRQHSLEEDDEHPKERSKLIDRIKALNPLQGHHRSISGFTIGDGPAGEITPNGPLSPESERSQPRYDDGSEVEADDESAGEGPAQPARRRRKTRRVDPDPATPKTTHAASFYRDSPGATPNTVAGYRPPFARRGTMTDIPENQRMGLSEDEGRDMLAKESAWRRGLHGRRRLSFSGRRPDAVHDSDGPRRPSHLRRFTGIGTRMDGQDSPSAWKQRSERTTSISAQKWRQLKQGLKMLGKQRKEENRIDHAKSAELVAELLAGAPAALFLASMFQRDEHGHKRVPILMEQLKVRITDSSKISDKAGDRHYSFRIELEYGSGMTRMKWVVHRTVRDFANLHLKYKTAITKEKYVRFRSEDSAHRSQLPRFPRSVLPYVRGMRGLMEDDQEDDDDDIPAGAVTDGEASGTEQRPPLKKHNRRSSRHTRRSSIGSPEQTPGIVGEMTARTGSFFGQVPPTPNPARKDTYQERQRKKLEQYLQQLITFVIFRPDSNRLCKFLELSALGVRLAQEGGYHGKEGFMMIQSTKAVNQRGWNPTFFNHQKHLPKWFLVRHSYICCVDSPEEMNIYDVFLVDPDFRIDEKKGAREMASKAKTSAAHPKAHQLRLVNSERRLKLLAKNERQMIQFQDSIKFMLSQTEWAKPHRFDSFAPVRYNVWAQWLVDARDYMWNVSRAISMARDVVYIHDWWLSPELYLRRPPAISQKWRLDRLLQRKAQEGVKIFIIVYRNVESAIPIDSGYTKESLLDLHPNIFFQRSPNQFKKNQFFWAHHEKICIVDHTVAFCGGVDLCFGRWDTPKHVLNDDKLTGFELDNNLPKDADHCQMWPGKDYSNPRVHDFYGLDKPYEEMYDREKVPRMPWHDIGMQIVGQPARDLTRHFVQRWNYLRRDKPPSRPTPYLLPPPDFNPADLKALGLDGTCEIQMLRSASRWSLGTPDRVECSIMNAYVKSIQASDHFVYIENQFFVSSCEMDGKKIVNKINDALVERIKRAHKNGETWRAIIIIPLMPGFQSTVDSQDGTSVRLIMQSQYRSICRGESSLFGRLRSAGIDPADYVEFYSLRSWGRIGPNKALTTEQLYIHAKCMIVDDRVVIIGSANINERSMLGFRDSEVAAIVRDYDMVDSMMGGRPYKVSKFAHSLRMRLMREHLGLDVDCIVEEAQSEVYQSDLSRPSTAESNPEIEQQLIENKYRAEEELIAREEAGHSFNHDVEITSTAPDPDISRAASPVESTFSNKLERERDLRGEGPDHMLEASARGLTRGRDSTIDTRGHEVLVSSTSPARPRKSSLLKAHDRPSSSNRRASASASSATNMEASYDGLPPPSMPRMSTRELGLTQLSQLPALPVQDDTDIGGPPVAHAFTVKGNEIINSLLATMRRPVVTNDCMADPINDSFYIDTWHTVAENNTKIYRQVFRCMPDSEVRTWKEYREYTAFEERFAKSMGTMYTRQDAKAAKESGPPGTATTINRKAHEKAHEAGKTMGHVGEKIADHLHLDPNMDATDHSTSKPSTATSQPNGAPIDEKANNGGLSPGGLSPTPLSPIDGASESFASESTMPANRHRERTITINAPQNPSSSTTNIPTPLSADGTGPGPQQQQPAKPLGSQRRRKRAPTRGSMRAFQAGDDAALLGKEDAETLLELVQGHLVAWPYDWLEKEEAGGGWLYAVDQIAPLEIYI
ncbi:hypothetical protein IWZ00DRAFT_556256 [Phyllosticta capitalensis]